jgi:hypothetical protein
LNNPTAFIKESFYCPLISQSVSIGGIKHMRYSKNLLLDDLIIDAECSGESTCKLSLRSINCPKKTNLNKSLEE